VGDQRADGARIALTPVVRDDHGAGFELIARTKGHGRLLAGYAQAGRHLEIGVRCLSVMRQVPRRR